MRMQESTDGQGEVQSQDREREEMQMNGRRRPGAGGPFGRRRDRGGADIPDGAERPAAACEEAACEAAETTAEAVGVSTGEGQREAERPAKRAEAGFARPPRRPGPGGDFERPEDGTDEAAGAVEMTAAVEADGSEGTERRGSGRRGEDREAPFRRPPKGFGERPGEGASDSAEEADGTTTV